MSKIQGGLGFKDIEWFNQALLGKQAWKILHYPECLLARFLKSRYFNHSDFHYANEGKRPSFGWRSIIYERELVQKGIRRKIGNVKSIYVWSEQWIEGDDEDSSDEEPHH